MAKKVQAKKENQLAVVADHKQSIQIQQLLSMAIEKGTPVEVMERMLDMASKIKKENARDAFNNAMADFQGECPTIKKTKGVPTRSGKIAYKYAPIETIVEQVKELIQKHGFSYSIKTDTVSENGKVSSIKSTCIVRHRLGHQEESDMEVPLGSKTEIMSDSQVVAAAATFSKRYAFCNAFGIMTGDEDLEGKDLKNVVDKKEKKVEIVDDDQKIKDAQIKLAQLLNVSSFDQVVPVANNLLPEYKHITAMPTKIGELRSLYMEILKVKNEGNGK